MTDRPLRDYDESEGGLYHYDAQHALSPVAVYTALAAVSVALIALGWCLRWLIVG